MIKTTVSIMILFSLFGHASEHKCSPWQKQSDVSCIFAGQDANLYRRQCEKPCWKNRHGTSNWNGDCDKEQVCYFESPTTFQNGCSKWVRVEGVSCYDPNSQTWAQQWARACSIALAETWCSPTAP